MTEKRIILWLKWRLSHWGKKQRFCINQHFCGFDCLLLFTFTGGKNQFNRQTAHNNTNSFSVKKNIFRIITELKLTKPNRNYLQSIDILTEPVWTSFYIFSLILNTYRARLVNFFHKRFYQFWKWIDTKLLRWYELFLCRDLPNLIHICVDVFYTLLRFPSLWLADTMAATNDSSNSTYYNSRFTLTRCILTQSNQHWNDVAAYDEIFEMHVQSGAYSMI